MVWTAAALLAGCASTPNPQVTFESCQAAKAAVASTGKVGLLVGPERVWDDPECYIAYDTAWLIFPVELTINGDMCRLGYTCIELVSHGF